MLAPADRRGHRAATCALAPDLRHVPGRPGPDRAGRSEPGGQRPRRHAGRRPADDRDRRTSTLDEDVRAAIARRGARRRTSCSSVSDTGTGMDAGDAGAHLRAVLHHQGAGQGDRPGPLTVYGIVKQSGGYVGVDSEPGAGTTFKVYLAAGHAVRRLARRERPPAGVRCAAARRSCWSRTSEGPRARAAILDDAATRCWRRERRARRCHLRAARAEIDLLLTDVVMPRDERTGACSTGSDAARITCLFMSGYTEMPLCSTAQSTWAGGSSASRSRSKRCFRPCARRSMQGPQSIPGVRTADTGGRGRRQGEPRRSPGTWRGSLRGRGAQPHVHPPETMIRSSVCPQRAHRLRKPKAHTRRRPRPSSRRSAS